MSSLWWGFPNHIALGHYIPECFVFIFSRVDRLILIIIVINSPLDEVQRALLHQFVKTERISTR